LKQDLTLTKAKEAFSSIQGDNMDYWIQFKGLSWQQFNEKIGMPLNVKTKLHTKIYQYEDDLIQSYLKHKMVWVKKATGLGITEITIRFIAWMCTTNDQFRDNQIDVSVVIFTGTRTRLAVQIIERMKGLFSDYTFEERETIGYVNGAKIESFPSSSTETARGLNPFIVFMDEGDFFEKNEQEEARTTAERYIIKTHPYIIFVSTPNLPGGLFETMEREEPSQYHKVFLPYTIGLRDGMYTEEEIIEGKKSPSFEREYNLQYGVGVGDIFPSLSVDAITEDYDLTLNNGPKLITVDPAYGSSNFAILGFELLDGIIYVKDSIEESRPSPAAMLEKLIWLSNKYNNCLMLVDSAHPGLIRDLQQRGINTQSLKFGAMSEDNTQSIISKMTFETSQAVQEKRVRIHKSFTTLLTQLKAVCFNSRGHPDKTKLNFDSGDCYIMGINHLKSNKIRIISVGINNEEDD
jgi:hypothetical protein